MPTKRSKSKKGKEMKGVLTKAEVASRGTGTAVRTPLEEFEQQPRDETRAFMSCVMFLTRLPCPGWCDHHPGHLLRGMAYFPLLGALIGVWQAIIYDAAASVFGPTIGAGISCGGTLWLTGCFHEDGLCDTLDAFGGGWSKSQILKIMRDSRNGSYATIGGAIWIVLKIVSVANIAKLETNPPGFFGSMEIVASSIIVGQSLSRATAVPLVYFYDYITDDDDAKGDFYNWFGESTRVLGWVRVCFCVVSAIVIALLALPQNLALQALICATCCGFLSGIYGNSILGGVIGDFLGATICMTELAIYLSISGDFYNADLNALARLVIPGTIVLLVCSRR